MKTLKELKQHLLEFDEEDIGQFVNKVVKDCGPFLDAIDGNVPQYKMYRGMEADTMGKKKVRKNRTPNDTPEVIHDAIDNYFTDNFGMPFRSNSVFSNGNWAEIDSYGKPHVIFPIGQFKFLWSPQIADLFTDMPTKDFMSTLNSTEDEAHENFQKELEDFLEDANYQTDNLKKAIESGHEIMVAADHYYYITKELFDEWGVGAEIQDAYDF